MLPETLKHAWDDHERQAHTIDRVELATGDQQYHDVQFDGGWGTAVPVSDRITPKVGDTITFWGRGIGYIIRGKAINDVVLEYRTEEEDRANHDAEQAKRDATRQAEYEQTRPDNDRRIAEMPFVFQKRIAGFRARRPDWGWRFEDYELFTCEGAIKIARAFPSRDAITAFHAQSYDEQCAALPGMSDQHSGNTFGAAVGLALLYLEHPELVPKAHGALTPLVGSDEYGDWATTDEAMQEREAAS